MATIFKASPNLTAGAGNTVTVVAQDYSSNTTNTTTQNYNVTLPSGASQTLTYDDAGNLTADGTRSYEWDTAGRLAAINSAGSRKSCWKCTRVLAAGAFHEHEVHFRETANTGSSPAKRSEFKYDGENRHTEIIEKENSVIVSQKRYLWCGLEICEERDSTGGTVNKRFFPQGVETGGADYCYTRDHLGSIRELTNSSSVVQVRYDYDPYGRQTKVSGSMDADFGFTGHFVHQASGLVLAPYRAYDPNFGRWTSRDPVQEKDGVNLYAYVGNRSASFYDADGRIGVSAVAGAIVGGIAGGAIG